MAEQLPDSIAEDGKPGHFCGIAGLWSAVPCEIPEALFYMLFSLQHRGQESAGLCWEDAASGRLLVRKDRGMVSSVLGSFVQDKIPSRCGIGHVRYSTAGGSGVENAQPLLVECNKGRIALAHNGNISNSEELRLKLSAEGAIFQTTSDTEIILHLMSRSRKESREDIVREAFGALEGAYSVVMLWDGELWAVRDPRGFRPLWTATEAGLVMVASETCAVEFRGPRETREVRPGEVLRFGPSGESSFLLDEKPEREARCVFELIYFARPDSSVFGQSVHEIRRRLGSALADIDRVKADVVIPVPESGNLAALGYARRAGVMFDFGLSRNHYAGRSFILPTKGQRELAVRMKLRPVSGVVAGKRVVMIDDSLVRGTTSKIIVRLLKEAGAREVHLRLSSPEIHHPCYYGIDIPTREELISNRLGPEGVAQEIGADSVLFLPISKMDECLSGEAEHYCHACFDGNHPCPRGDRGAGCR